MQIESPDELRAVAQGTVTRCAIGNARGSPTSDSVSCWIWDSSSLTRTSAALWAAGRKPGLYSMRDVLGFGNQGSAHGRK